MRQFVWGWMLLSGALAVLPTAVEAQVFRRPFRGCCETCEQPHAACSCTLTRPVVQTQLRAQQVMTFRDVTETHVRNETVVQNIPVTTFKQVTVDEGGYQMVWVPKPVTKQVAQTVIQQQAQTRAVPYQVTRRIPQMATQLVPVQTVQHVTETIPMTSFAPSPVLFQAASSCNTCNAPHATAFAPQFIAPQYGAALAPPIQYAPSAYAPSAGTIPTMPAISVPLPQTALAPAAPEPAGQWQTVPSRPAPAASRDYDSPSSRSVPVPTDEARRTPRTSQFVPAPSAATVWNSRGSSFR